jgi:hypothetical protein
MPMGVNITKSNIDEFLTSYIDGENHDTALDNEVKRFIEADETVSKKYMAEVLTKRLFSSRLKTVEVPDHLVNKINNSLDSVFISSEEKYASSVNTREVFSGTFWEYLKNLISTPVKVRNFSVPRYAFALVLLFVLVGAGLLMNAGKIELNPYIAAGSEKSVMVQAVNNFHKLLAGDMKPEMESNDAMKVREFVKHKANMDAFVPAINGYVLVGAKCSEYNGQMLAHLVYSSGNEVIYIYEACVSSLHSKSLELPDPVHSDIVKNKYYMCDKVDDNQCTMIIWYSDNVICASVSTMPKHKMFAHFTSFR